MLTALNLTAIGPEIALLVLVALAMLTDLFAQNPQPKVHQISVIGLLLIALWQAVMAFHTEPALAMNNLVVVDPLSAVLKAAAAFTTAMALVYGRGTLAHQQMGFGEFHFFALFSLLGGFVMISSAHLLSIYLGIELLSLSLYAAVALRRDHAASTEAAMKYFVLGALASGFLLYGMSMIYGATGSLELPVIQDRLASGAADRLVMVFGTVFLVAGIAFKLGAVPFHMWVPDVYEGSPTASTLLIGAAPKIAGFALVIRLLVSGLLGVAEDWQQMLYLLAGLSLAVGNLVAIVQTNLKRILAYSTISHMGFMLLGLLSGVGAGHAVNPIEAYGASMFYVLTYALTSLASFGVILLASRQGLAFDTLEDFKGLAKTHPALALVTLVVVFSLAGIPPTVGFYAKLAVLDAALQAGHIGLVVFAVMASLVGAFFYLRIVKVMYFDEPIARDAELTAAMATPTAILPLRLIQVNGALLLVLGLLPAPLMTVCLEAIRASLAV